MKDGEWEPKFNSMSNSVLILRRDGKEWWVWGGSFFCDSYGGPRVAGLWLRHWVYYAAANKIRKEGNKKYRMEANENIIKKWMD